jgi:hypothetical protein
MRSRLERRVVTASSLLGLLAPLVVAAGLVACGATPPALPVPEPKPMEAAPPAAPAASAAPAVDEAAAAQCFATAGAKRAKFSGEPPKVTVKHVLVKYEGAKNADPAIKRTRAEACLRAIAARDKVREGASFGDVVKEFSDEAGAATREGSLGAVERKDVAKPFADAAFELSVNQLSDVVESEFGFHVILRSE